MRVFMINKRRLILSITTMLITIIVMNGFRLCQNSYAAPSSITKEELKDKIETLYNTRSSLFPSGDLTSLKSMFDLSRTQAQWSLEHEARRIKYLRDWSAKRHIKFTKINSTIRIKKVFDRGNILRIPLEETYQFDYIYTQDQTPVTNSFGVGIRHTLSLIKQNDNWLILSDWYTDCFEDAMGAYSATITTPQAIQPEAANETMKKTSLDIKPYYGYNRQKAVAYADKYCGAAWGSTNQFKYNKKYNDYNGMGGDCTNYVSQVLGDKDAGGLRQGGGWHPDSRAWANVNGLRDHIIYSGRGYVLGKGTFEELTKPQTNHPDGIVSRLMPGDLVCYVKKGDPNHFAVVTGKDSNGYPLVNSHTTDRYHVPWDLGWGDKNIKFILIHITG